MKGKKFLWLGMLALSCTLQSCMDDDNDIFRTQPTALVTVRPMGEGSFILQLDDSTTLYPTNMHGTPYGQKCVRALVNYSEQKRLDNGLRRYVFIHWIDTIRTKPALRVTTAEAATYGGDPIEVVKDWVTVAEDGFLTLRVRMKCSSPGVLHKVNLLSVADAGDSMELYLCHDAQGDVQGSMGDALIAFDLRALNLSAGNPVKFSLVWPSYEGRKTMDFVLRPERPLLFPVAESDN